MFTNLDDLSPLAEDSSLWNDELDLSSVPACNELQSSLDSENLFDPTDSVISSNTLDNDFLTGRGLEEFSTQLGDLTAPLESQSDPACVNRDFEFRTPPKGNTNTDETGNSSDERDQNAEPEAPVPDLPTLQLQPEPACPQEPFYGYVEDLCCADGPYGVFYMYCARCKLLNIYAPPSGFIPTPLSKLITISGSDTPDNLLCIKNRYCCRIFLAPVSNYLWSNWRENFNWMRFADEVGIMSSWVWGRIVFLSEDHIQLWNLFPAMRQDHLSSERWN